MTAPLAYIPEYSPSENMSAVEAVMRCLRTDILRGRIAPGQKLPPERELAAFLGVNRLTLRAALSRLIAAGLLASQQGDGNRVLDYRVHSGLESLPALANALADDAGQVLALVNDLLALWRAVMSEVIPAAVRNATPADLAHLRQLADDQSQRMDDLGEFMEGDLAFSRYLTRLSGNLAFELVFNTFIRFGRDQTEIFELFFTDPELNCRAYEGVLIVLASGEVEAAHEAVRMGLQVQHEAVIQHINAYLAARHAALDASADGANR
jgi:GntR family transcriptional regulator, transcriptional repressor for pyruvate dehydrogenase complex